MKKYLFPVFAFSTFFIAAAISFAAFPDVNNSTRYHTAIDYAESYQIVSGYPDGSFKPQNRINRAEFTKIIVAAQLGYDPAQDPSGFDIYSLVGVHFSDITAGQWYVPYLRRAVNVEYISGYPDGTFKPANDISFVEAAKIIAKGFALPATSDSIWYKPYVNALAERKAIPTTITSFEYKISRAEMVEIIYRLKKNITNQPSSDYNKLSGAPSGNTGAADPRWDSEDLSQLKSVPGSALKVVQSDPILK